MNSSRVLLNTAYFPPIQYFSKIVKYNKVIIEQYESYGKQSFRNRCDIYGANGKLTLSVPVVEGARKKVLTKDVKIEYITNWQKIHFKSMESAYRRSPYYEYYIDDIEPLFIKNYNYLLEFNNAIIEVVNDILDISPEIEMTGDYITDLEGFSDWREGIHPKKSRRKEDNEFTPTEYTQVFSDRGGFIPNLSILDLIFNMGPESLDYLESTLK